MKYTLAECIKIARQCQTYKEFRLSYQRYYYACQRNGWLNEIHKILPFSNNLSKRCIYLILFENKIVYIGLTWDFSERINAHLHKRGTVFNYIKEYNTQPIEIKQLTDYINDDLASFKEQEYIKQFKSDGYTLLNKNKGGTLGINCIVSNITKKKCKDILIDLNYNIRQFRLYYPKYYNKCSKNKWFYELIPNYKKCYNNEYDYDNLINIIKSCPSRQYFKLNYRNHYNYAIKHKILQKLFDECSLNSSHIHNKILQYENTIFIKEYKSIEEIIKENPNYNKSTLYNAIRRKCRAYGYYWEYKLK